MRRKIIDETVRRSSDISDNLSKSIQFNIDYIEKITMSPGQIVSDYKNEVDYIIKDNKIDWSPGANSIAAGTTYYVTYTYSSVRKTFLQLIKSMISRAQEQQPSVDMKVGTVVRDIFIEPPAEELRTAYIENQRLQSNQSILSCRGVDLDALVANFNITRNQPTKSKGTVFVGYLVEPTIPKDIEKGDLIGTLPASEEGTIIFIVQDNYEWIPDSDGKYTHYYRPSVGGWGVEVLVEAQMAGEQGNVREGEIDTYIAPFRDFTIIKNEKAFSGGQDEEGDQELRDRTKGILSGNSAGTINCYKNTAMELSAVDDAYVADASDELMLRDGELGGKVDLYLKGKISTQVIEEHIKGSNNYFILENQPVLDVISVVGNTVGFLTEGVDFELEKTTGYFSNSTRSQDKIKFLGNNDPALNEKVTITYLYNSLLKETEDKLEPKRTVTCDLLVKSAEEKKINISMGISISVGYSAGNVTDEVVAAILKHFSALKLGAAVEQSDLVAAAHGINGVSNVKIPLFQLALEEEGMIAHDIYLGNNQWATANNLNVQVV